MTGPEAATSRSRYAGVCAPRAEIFGEGISYVSGWADARQAGAELAKHLQRAGLAELFSGLRPDVSVQGDGLVIIGSVPADAAQRLADLLLRGLCAELDCSLGDPGQSSVA